MSRIKRAEVFGELWHTFFESGAPKNEAWTHEPPFITHTGLGVIKSSDHSSIGIAVIDLMAT